MKSPMQRSLKALRDEGWTCVIVEHWNPFAKCKQDLFGFIDILAVKNGKTMGVQTTTSSHMAERIKKIRASEYFPILLSAGWDILVHGWYTDKNDLRSEIIS